MFFGHRLYKRSVKRSLADIILAVLKGLQLPAETKKAGNKLEAKEAVTGPAVANTAQKPAATLKSQKENMPRYDSTSHWFSVYSFTHRCLDLL